MAMHGRLWDVQYQRHLSHDHSLSDPCSGCWPICKHQIWTGYFVSGSRQATGQSFTNNQSNQGDMEEQNRQVRIMDQIYLRTYTVVV
jgi:hypothetical protein